MQLNISRSGLSEKLRLMPLFKAPPGENDGGYAVSSYREVNPSLGTMQQLVELTTITSCQLLVYRT